MKCENKNDYFPTESVSRGKANESSGVALKYSWELLCDLEKRFGDLYYILDEQGFLSNIHELHGEFKKHYPNSSIAYSYKTNYTPRLCHLADQIGAYAEVVSKLEYDLAIHLGVDPARIIFNGPLKLPEELEEAMLAGSIINLDGPYEIELAESIAHKYPDKTFALGLRCNFDLGTGHISRFGFDVEGSNIHDIALRINRIKNCSITGLHCHFSGARSSDLFIRRIERLLELFFKLRDDLELTYIDIGGGFFGKMPLSLKEQFNCPIPDYAEYAEAIAGRMARSFPDGAGPEMIIEPGIGILGDVMRLVTKIIGLKKIRNKTFAQCTGGIHNIKPIYNDNNLPIKVYRKNGDGFQKSPVDIDIGGYTCMEHDILYRGYKGYLSPGDYVMIENVGAYTNVLTPPFIRSSPPIIAFDDHCGEFRLIKRGEGFDDVFSPYVMDINV
jgi:diaminopimelate decarboxylase